MDLGFYLKIGMTIVSLLPTVIEFIKDAEEAFKDITGAGAAKKQVVMEQVKALVAVMVDTAQEFTPDNIDLVMDKVEYTIGKFVDVAVQWIWPKE